MSGKIKILIVEDERLIAEDIKGSLVKKGYDVIGIASSGNEALDMALNLMPDLALMDIMLNGPDDGIETALEIVREIDIPVIYLTAYADEDTLSRAKISEPYGYLLKPFEDRELFSNIEIALHNHAMRKMVKASEKRYHTFTDNAASAIFIVNDWNMLYVNPAATELTGYRNEELLSKNFLEIVHPDFQDLIIDCFNRVHLGDRTCTRYGFKILTKNSAERWVHFNSTLIDYDNKAAILGEAVDVTEQKRAGDQIRRNNENLRKALNGIILSMAMTLEVRDPYTAGHQRGVADLAQAIAIEMDLPSDQVEGIRVAAAIHDLGKISIPAEILSKPARLNDIEYQIVKGHSQIGYDILRNIDFPWPVAEIVYQHHERLNGSGYPRGLSGSQILIEAKIIMVADVVESMSSHRPYRPSLGVSKALEEINGKKGIDYDSETVDACLRVFNSRGFIFK